MTQIFLKWQRFIHTRPPGSKPLKLREQYNAEIKRNWPTGRFKLHTEKVLTSKGGINTKKRIERQGWVLEKSGWNCRVHFQVLPSCRTTFNFLHIPMCARIREVKDGPSVTLPVHGGPGCKWLSDAKPCAFTVYYLPMQPEYKLPEQNNYSVLHPLTCIRGMDAILCFQVSLPLPWPCSY